MRKLNAVILVALVIALGSTMAQAATLLSVTVPDGGMTIMMLGGVLVGIEGLRRRFRP